jgi:hypothetical protein
MSINKARFDVGYKTSYTQEHNYTYCDSVVCRGRFYGEGSTDDWLAGRELNGNIW